MEDILPCLELYLFTVEQFAKEVLFIGKKRSMRSTTNANLLVMTIFPILSSLYFYGLLVVLGSRCLENNAAPSDEVAWSSRSEM